MVDKCYSYGTSGQLNLISVNITAISIIAVSSRNSFERTKCCVFYVLALYEQGEVKPTGTIVVIVCKLSPSMKQFYVLTEILSFAFFSSFFF